MPFTAKSKTWSLISSLVMNSNLGFLQITIWFMISHFFYLKNGCVKDLRLTRCDITLFRDMGIKSLASVFLDQLYLSDQMVCELVSGCVSFESFCLEYCFGMKEVKICSLKLKVLKLNYFNCNDGSILISCPNLGLLEMIGFEVEKYDFKDLSAVVEASCFFLHKLEYYRHWSQVVRCVAHVKCLTVQNWWHRLLASKNIFSGSTLLHNLKHLELRTEDSRSDLLGIAALLELTPNLETMIVDYLCKIDDDECLPEDLLNEPVEFMLPNLKQVKIKDFRTTENMGLFLTLLILHGVVLEKIILVPTMVGETLVPPVVLHRQLKQVKFSLAQAQKISFKDVGGELGIFME